MTRQNRVVTHRRIRRRWMARDLSRPDYCFRPMGQSLEARTVLAAAPIISELMASNQATLDDNDRDSSDWVEIYNAGDEPANLEGWHLTDSANNLAKWQFPAVTLDPQGFLVVFASGKNRTDDDGEMHTNFRLSGDGEYLALVGPDGQTIVSQIAPEFPMQFTDVAYGLRMSDAGAIDSVHGYFTSPTPGELNPSKFTLGPTIRGVSHSPREPDVGESVTVTATIAQTLHPVQQVDLVYRVMYADEVTVAMSDDGTGADVIAGDGIFTATIPAGVAEPGQMLRYYVVATDTDQERSRNPRVVDTTGTDRSPEYYGTVVNDTSLSDNLPVFHWFAERASRGRSRAGTRASVYYLGEFYDNIFVRQRGGATNGASQKFNFDDDQKFYVNEQLGRVAEINLNAQGSDPSFLRQSLAFEAYAWAGSETSASFLMQMRVNGEADRIGVFIEQVDEDLLKRHGLDPSGALYKFVQRSNLNPVFADTITGIEKKTRLDEDDSDVQVVVDGLTQPEAADRAASVFDNFNVAQLLNYLAVRSVTMDADDVRKNFYLYRDTLGTGQWSILPWDKDWTFGVLGDGGPSLSHPFFGDEAHLKPNANQWNRLYDAVFTDPVLSEMYLRRLRSVMDLILQPPGTPAEQARFETRVDEMLEEAGDLLPTSAIRQAENSVKRFFPERRNTLYLEHSIDNLLQTELHDLIPEFVEGVQFFVPTDDALGDSWTGIADPPNAAQWQSGPNGFGFHERFDEWIRTTVSPADACAECTSLMLRIPFQLENATAIEFLTLRMRYDDGFIAYLNGTEIARSNYEDAPAYNGRARTRANALAVEFENFNVSQFAHLLNEGDNVLAIQAFNSSATSNDMLVFPVLLEGLIGDDSVAGIPHEQTGHPEIRFGHFDANPVSGNQTEEYIELRNPLETAVDISGWQLAGGIQHAFPPGSVIPSGGSLFVTPDVKSFLARTIGPRGGEGRFVQGNYFGSLATLADAIRLEAPDGTVLDSLVMNPDLTQDGRVGAADIDRLCQAIQNNEDGFDINRDAIIDQDDLTFFVRNLLRTSMGDANVDGVFDSNDLIHVLSAGEYEDQIQGNSTWVDGDWNCDGEFTSDDLFAVIQAGSYLP